jgi:hypothetical protein
MIPHSPDQDSANQKSEKHPARARRQRAHILIQQHQGFIHWGHEENEPCDLSLALARNPIFLNIKEAYPSPETLHQHVQCAKGASLEPVIHAIGHSPQLTVSRLTNRLHWVVSDVHQPQAVQDNRPQLFSLLLSQM